MIFCILFLTNNISLIEAQKFKDVEITVNQLTNATFMLEGKGGNIGLSIGNDGVLLIDSQFEQLTDKILSSINSITNKPIKFVINTHWHQDHSGGNENLAKEGAIILAHEAVHERLSTKQFVEFLDREYQPSPIEALPTMTYNGSITLHFNDDKIDIYHIPYSHTDGDSIIYFNKNNILHTGDIFVNGRYPFIDQSSGGSIDGLIIGIEKIITIINNETKIIASHGSIANIDDLQEYLIVLKDTRQEVYKMISNDADLKQVINSNIAANYDSKYADSFINSEDFLGFVYNNLQS